MTLRVQPARPHHPAQQQSHTIKNYLEGLAKLFHKRRFNSPGTHEVFYYPGQIYYDISPPT